VLEVEMHPRMVDRLTGSAASALVAVEEETSKRIVVRGVGGGVPLDHCELAGQ
jgi:hypothetical protein